MENEVKNIQMAFTCRENWDDMIAVDGGRFCNVCNKKVYDFTDAKVQQFLQIMAENDNHICGRFRKDQIAPAPLPAWKKYFSAALVLIGINIFHNKVNAQVPDSISAKTQKTSQDLMVFGGVERSAEFPGGIEGLTKFLDDHIHHVKGMVAGKVFLTFIVRKDGTLADIKILRGLTTLNNNEAIRVLQLSPKWNPGEQFGKPADQQYTLPITFK